MDNTINETENTKGVLYRIIDRVKPLRSLVRKGGIKFKWATVISFIIVLVTLMFVMVFMIMSTNALLKANDKLCQTIAGNISATEPILTAEKKPYRRSLILQDVVSSLSRNAIEGLEYAAVYDLTGKLSERKLTYAAHTISSKQLTWIPRKIYPQLKKVEEFEKTKIILKKRKSEVPCYQYRMPFTFFDVKVGVIEIVFTEESILAPIKEAALYISLLGALLLIIGVFLSTKVSGGMVKPISKLSQGMVQVKKGFLETRIAIYRHDELGDLSLEFNTMITHLREKLFMQKFVSDSTISMIRERTQNSHDNNLDLGGSRQNLAFLFSDVRGFTAMSEKIDPEDVVLILNEYLDIQAQIEKEHNGDIDKFVGDEIMAVFSGDARADNGLAASIDIIKRIKLLNAERKEKGLITVEVGIGLNIGDVVHGRIGSRDRMDNTSIGDAVNLAARLCSSAEGGQILASEAIIKKAPSGKYKGKKLQPITVKGKAKPVAIYSILSKK